MVIGLDGVGLPLVEQLMARGDMPAFARLCERGTLAPMLSTIPTVSSVSWTGFMTGRNPGKHGIYGFTDVRPGTLSLFFPNYGDVRCQTLWDVLGAAGRRAVVVNIPNTYPARPIAGVLISGFVAVNIERAVQPPTLLPFLQSAGYRIDVDYLNANERAEAFFQDLEATLAARRRVLRHLLCEEQWDLFVGVITETDRLHHYFWDQYLDPAAPYHGRFRDFYRRLDEVIGELASLVPEDVPLFVLADHGHTLIKREFYPNTWLREKGWLKLRGERPRSLADIDPSSKAFVLDPGRIYLHRRGRFPLGTVDEQEAEELAEAIAEGLAAVSADGEDGGRPVTAVYRREDLYEGPYLDAAPDLVLHFADGFDIKGAIAKGDLFGRSALTGMHTYADSLFYVSRRGVAVDGLAIIDLAPTLLRLLGVEPPPDMDGRARLG